MQVYRRPRATLRKREGGGLTMPPRRHENGETNRRYVVGAHMPTPVGPKPPATYPFASIAALVAGSVV